MDQQLNTKLYEHFQQIITIISEHYNTRIDSMQTEIGQLNKTIELQNENIKELTENRDLDLLEIEKLKIQYNDLNDDFKNYQKVSIVKNLNKQLYEKETELSILNKKLESLEKLQQPNVKLQIDPIPKEIPPESIEDVDEESIEEVAKESIEDVDEESIEEVAEDVDEESIEEVAKESIEEVAKESIEDVDEESIEDVDEASVEDVDEESVEEIELNLYEKKLKPPNGTGRQTYYITEDENRDIYEKLDNDEVGECIGKLVGKNNRPHFFST